MTNSISPSTGTISSSVCAAVTASSSSTSFAAHPSPAPTGQASGKLRLSQPEAAALILTTVRQYILDETEGRRRNSLAIRATPGAQKTRSITDAVAENYASIQAGRLKTIIIAREHTQTRAYQSRFIERGILDSEIYYGRTAPESSKGPEAQADTVCYQLDAVAAAGKSGHLPSGTACRQCPVGLAMSVKRLQEQIDSGAAWTEAPEKKLRATEDALDQAYRHSRMTPAQVDAIVAAGGCAIHRAIPKYHAAGLLLTTPNSFSRSLTETEDGRPCLVIIDEGVELAKEVPLIDGAALDGWLHEVEEAEAVTGRTYPEVREVLQLIEAMKAERGRIEKTITQFLERFGALRKRYDLTDDDTPFWERPHWSRDTPGKFIAPLRAASALARALEGHTTKTAKGGRVVFSDAGIRVTVWTPAGARLVSGDTIIADATITDSTVAALRVACGRVTVRKRLPRLPPPQLGLKGIKGMPRPAAKSTTKSGTTPEPQIVEVSRPTDLDLVDVVVPQNVVVGALDGKSYSRGDKRRPGYRARVEHNAEDVADFIRSTFAAGPDCKTKVLTHLLLEREPAVQAALKECGMEASRVIGHWGRDHIAHNDWAGSDLVMLGLPWPAPDRLRAEWARTGSYDPRLPDEPPETLRLELVTADIVQAVGRTRAIYASPDNPVRVTIAARIPPELRTMLEQHGITIAETRENPLRRQKATLYELAQKMLPTIESMIRRGSSPTVNNIAAGVRAGGGHAGTELVSAACEALIPAAKRGAKRLGYRHLARQYVIAILRWREAARQAIYRAADKAAKAVSGAHRARVSRVLCGLGDWLRWTPALPAAPPAPA